MKALIALWNWFNGKKTVIGLGLIGIATFISEIVIGKWGVTAEWVPKLMETLAYLGVVLTGGGLLHKGAKGISTAAEK